ncbi:MAG: hypothetical protein QOI80_168 [Solirubrobacteraceae bacterium]|jgi:hypothetical protein|nr:hypothetical protein [Solirubrobacteraceae bacterium]
MELLGTEARRVRLWALVAVALLVVAIAPALALAGLPLNDDLGGATKLNGAHPSALGTNVLASKQPGEPNHAGNPGGASVWYSWTPDRSGPAQANTCSNATTFNSLVAVYTRSGATPPFSNLNLVAGNDDHPGGACSANRSRVDFDVKGGTTYYVAVDGEGGATGAFQLNVGEVSDYAGTTSQGHAIRFRLSGDRRRVTGMKVRLTAACRLTAGSSTTDTFPLAGLPKFKLHHGAFGRTLAKTAQGVWEEKRVRGARSGRAFKGTVRYQTSSLGGSCDSRKVGWTARPKTLAGLP